MRAGYRSPFESRYVVRPSGCWEWITGHFATGYGNYRNGYAHRAAWERANGPIPDGLQVLHHCDNKPCVNPEHLYVGTPADNARDAIERGQLPRGERHWNARLTVQDIHEIRRRAAGLTHAAIASEFGVTREAIRDILKGKLWSSVEVTPEERASREAWTLRLIVCIRGHGPKERTAHGLVCRECRRAANRRYRQRVAA